MVDAIEPECVIVDGVLSPESWQGKRGHCYIVTPDGVVGAGAGDLQANTHADYVKRVILAVEPQARLHGVAVFDESEAPVSRILLGLKHAVALRTSVVCLPWAIRQTATSREFEAVCRDAAERGIIIVAAFPADIRSAVPGSFSCVIGVSRFRVEAESSAHVSLSWLPSMQSVATVWSTSLGTALVAGLALIWARRGGRRDRDCFSASLEAFAAYIVQTPDSTLGPGSGTLGSVHGFGALAEKYSLFLSSHPFLGNTEALR